MEHHLFSLENPNKVRSLVGAFSSNNLIGFNTEEGYQFLADQVLALNSLNPQMASRMVSIFNSWKKLDKSLRDLIKPELKRIHTSEGLSPDVFEIVNKALKDD
jgi:aminopeptidase N